MDYETLLKKYIEYVCECEGIDYITECVGIAQRDFSKEEWDELEKISKLVNYNY